ncbi:MAG: hypothetical protein AB1656_24260 [Candidatus Omnitrophota bacterium]
MKRMLLVLSLSLLAGLGFYGLAQVAPEEPAVAASAQEAAPVVPPSPGYAAAPQPAPQPKQQRGGVMNGMGYGMGGMIGAPAGGMGKGMGGMMGGMGMGLPGGGMVGFSGGIPGPDFQPDPEFLKKTKIAIEVMSRIIDSRLQEALGESYKSKGFFSKGCQGYWIPGLGVLFTLGVDFPLHRENGEKKEEAEESHEKDEWDEILDKIEVKEASPQSSDRYDENKVERLKTRILNVLAKYGKRFEGFNPNETITVVIEGASLNGPFDLTRMYRNITPRRQGGVYGSGAYGGFSTGGGYGARFQSSGAKDNDEVEQLKKELEDLKSLLKADSESKKAKSEEDRQPEDVIKKQEEAGRRLLIDTLQLELAKIRSSMDELKDRTDEESTAKRKELEKQQNNIEIELKKIEVDKSEKELSKIKEMTEKGIQQKRVDVIVEPIPGENKVVIENRIKKSQDAVNAMKDLYSFQYDLTPGAPDNGQSTAMIIRICFSCIPEDAEGMEEIQDAVSIVTY